jgi:ABC-2 type transport system permease protein
MSISFRRIYAIMLRDFYADQRSIMRLTDIFYYPAIDITLWGLTSQWLKQGSNSTIMVAMATCLVLWQVVARNILSISVGMVEELWYHTLVNLFGSPLKLSEWTLAMMLSGTCKTLFVLPYGATLAWFAYGVNIFNIGPMIVLYLVLLMASGWTIGFLGASILLHWGRHAQSTPWMITWFFVPTCAIYFPVANLPKYFKVFALCTPLGHIFEAVRYQILAHSIAYGHLGIAAIMVAVYFTLSIMLFRRTFAKALVKGLSSLE